jgi:MFS family permease
MQNRWLILAILFLSRTAMGFQFQAVAALAPIYIETYQVGLAQIGVLIGLYLAPGLVIAFPGGALAARFGDKRVMVFALALMVVGGAIVAFGAGWSAQVSGRVVAGVGGVLLNVTMTKLVTDYFSGREIATAMAIFVNSWPVGIALALIVLPWIGAAGGLQTALFAVLIVAVLGLALFAFGYRSPESGTVAPPEIRSLSGQALRGVVLAGAIWGLYNGALGMVFGFGPAMLAERGWSLAAASSATSLVLWLAAIAVPLGGVLSDWLRRKDLVTILSCAGFAVFLGIAAETDAIRFSFIAIGLIGGLAAGPIMSLTSEMLTPANRAIGMGAFYTMFYVGAVGAPMVAGALAEAFGSARFAFHFGALMLIAAIVVLGIFRRNQRRMPM